MKSIREADLAGKKIILRADYNVPIDDGNILEDERIRSSVETIRYILEKKPAFLMVISHLGKPEGERVDTFSLVPVGKKLEELLGYRVEMISDIGEIEYYRQNSSGQSIYLLENIRFWKEEEEGDSEFAAQVAEGFDVFINDAFSVSHRSHASVTEMPKHLSRKYAGLLLEKEYNELSRAKDNPDHPAVAIIGGAKIETKLPVINNLIPIYDRILVGGMIANEAIDQGLEKGDKVVLPVDFGPEELQDQRLDIGPETIASFVKEIQQAGSIIWNGPLGKFEAEGCEQGTKQILAAILDNVDAYKIIGGGETIEAVRMLGNLKDFNYVSMSGGAMLEFLAGDKLPGIEALG